MLDLIKIRRETIRWQILLTLNNARPVGTFDSVILSVVRAEYPDSTPLEIRRELDYLESRELVKIERKPDGRWHCDLTRYGVDVAEYTVAVEPGIARPEKYSAE
jgi:hypothetical protein